MLEHLLDQIGFDIDAIEIPTDQRRGEEEEEEVYSLADRGRNREDAFFFIPHPLPVHLHRATWCSGRESFGVIHREGNHR